MSTVVQDDRDRELEVFEPEAKHRHARWCVEHLVTDVGRAYDPASYPHNSAPGGPADMLDDIHCRTITLQFGTRLGKTFFSQGALLYFADTDACPMMVATETEKQLKKKFVHRLYKMINNMPQVQSRLIHKNKRDQASDLVEFRRCQIVGAWAGSPGTLGDENIRVGVANELDKPGWEGVSTSREGSPIKLFDERFKDFWSYRKQIYESTPTVRGKSRIESRRVRGTNCRYFVPCPHCGKYQPIRFGERDERGELVDDRPGRLEFEKHPSGRWDQAHARRTAHYVCVSGECDPILDHHRPEMLRHGVWVPEGCTAIDDKARAAAEHWYEDMIANYSDDGDELWHGWENADWIEGPTPDDENASYHLPSLCALSLGWGDVAAEYVSCLKKPTEMHNFKNGWLAETVEIRQHTTTWEDLGGRFIAPQFQAVIPEWATYVVAAVDRQKVFLPYGVFAYGPEYRHQCIEYGDMDHVTEVEHLILDRTFEREDDRPGQKPCFCLIDDGFRPDSAVTDFCLKMVKDKKFQCWPCKGSNKALDSDFKLAVLGKNTRTPGMHLYWIDTIRTQRWVEGILHTVMPGDAGAGSIHHGTVAEHQDILEQLLNDTSILENDSNNNERESWRRVNTDIPNDYRDIWRYGYIAILAATRGAPIRPPGDIAPPTNKAKVVNPGIQTPNRRW
tara:strand:- start:23809 stop:25836 length:2028 start_codon:yes stop_codon:yes gene_type:complete